MLASRSKQRVLRLQNLDRSAWEIVLRRHVKRDDLYVHLVETERVSAASTSSGISETIRYLVYLANYSDPIPFIGITTTSQQANFYKTVADDISFIAPRCLFTFANDSEGWLILEDTPNDRPPVDWMAGDIEDIVANLADFHALYWNQTDKFSQLDWLPYFLGERRKPTKLEAVENESLSEQAQHSVLALAPKWREAAGGLRLLLELDGWQGVLGEKHLRAAADLIDDPLPMLHLLRDLPVTLIHGYPGMYNWRVSGWESQRLQNWQDAAIGPGICDLVAFIETFGLLQEGNVAWRMREVWPIAEETLIDNYILRLRLTLGNSCDAYLLRKAIPAARCLHVLLHWFPRFNKWFSQLPAEQETRRAMWHIVNADDSLTKSAYRPIISLKPFLAQTFHRFVRAYYQIQ